MGWLNWLTPRLRQDEKKEREAQEALDRVRQQPEKYKIRTELRKSLRADLSLVHSSDLVEQPPAESFPPQE